MGGLLALTLGGARGVQADEIEDEDVWSIRCVDVRGENRKTMANKYAAELREVKGIKRELVQVMEQADTSSIFYGKYKRLYDTKKKTERYRPDPIPDLNLIRSLSVTIPDETGHPAQAYPFYLATLDTLPGGRPSHPEWDISNAHGYWSLQVAVFYNINEFRERKSAAEQYCKMLRDKGEEAYVHHGSDKSSVCIGAFPKEAIQEFRKEDSFSGVVTFTNRIVDKRMLATQKKYPENLENGYKMFDIEHDPKTGARTRVPRESFAVEIPQPQNTAAGEGQPDRKAGKKP
jgi:hypothetical protein